MITQDELEMFIDEWTTTDNHNADDKENSNDN